MTQTPASTDLRFAGLRTGDEYYVSEWFELDEAHLREFAHSTYLDSAHVDLTFSQNNPLGADLVDGFWMLSMLLFFNFKYGKGEADSEYGFNYGVDNVRFTAPLMLGERIRVRAHIEGIRGHAQGTLVSTRHVMEIEGKEKPCMIATMHTLRIDPEEG